jgi:hypothetical protein
MGWRMVKKLPAANAENAQVGSLPTRALKRLQAA